MRVLYAVGAIRLRRVELVHAIQGPVEAAAFVELERIIHENPGVDVEDLLGEKTQAMAMRLRGFAHGVLAIEVCPGSPQRLTLSSSLLEEMQTGAVTLTSLLYPEPGFAEWLVPTLTLENGLVLCEDCAIPLSNVKAMYLAGVTTAGGDIADPP